MSNNKSIKKIAYTLISLVMILCFLLQPAYVMADTTGSNDGNNPTSTATAAANSNQNTGDTVKYKTGLYKVDGVWKYYENGRFKAATGLAKRPDNGKWYYVEKGFYSRRTTIAKKIVKNGDNNWYFVRSGAYSKETGLAKRHDNGRWYVINKGKYNRKYTGIIQSLSNGRWYYAKNGAYNTRFTGYVKYKGTKYYVKRGAVKGPVPEENSLTYIKQNAANPVLKKNSVPVNQNYGTANSILKVMRSWLGIKIGSAGHKEIIDIYNSYLPTPVKYKVTYTDAWCDAGLSAAAIKAGCSDLIGRECGVGRHVELFKAMGIWIEDGTITPKPGDIIVYSWGNTTQPNDTGASHIGIVESVKNGQITTIECNHLDMVARRVIPVGYGTIRGYARPKYMGK